jgi:RimJ/RimL family protein N-acetyltransferase
MKIKGQRIILSDDPHDPEGDTFFKWLNLEEWKYYDQPDQPFQPISREEFDEMAKKNAERASSSSQGKSWHIDTLDGQHIGWVNSYKWDEEESAFIGICIPEEELWGKGYGSEAVSLFLNSLFDSFSLKSIRAATWTGNHRMVRCAQKAGFTNYELMPHRSPTSVRGETLERIEFTLTREEWSRNRESS